MNMMIKPEVLAPQFPMMHIVLSSVEFLDILNVVHPDETVNAYIDRYEIEKINAAIVGGVK